MGTIKIGSSSLKKGVTIIPSTVLFDGNNVKKIVNREVNKTLWGKGFIYDHGDEYELITGGWVGINADSNYQKAGGSLTKNDDHMLVKNVSMGSYSTTSVNPIDLSEYSKLIITAKSTGSIAVLIGGFPSSSFALKQVIQPTVNEYEDFIIDISTLSGKYGIAICDNSATGNLCIQAIMLLE